MSLLEAAESGSITIDTPGPTCVTHGGPQQNPSLTGVSADTASDCFTPPTAGSFTRTPATRPL